MLDENAPTGFQGYCIDLLDEIANILKFDYIIYEVRDKAYGDVDDKGKWNGVLGEMVYKRADIGLPLWYVTSERDEAVDFTTPMTEMTGQSILMKREVKSRSLFKFVKVLEWEVWLCIFVAFSSTRYFVYGISGAKIMAELFSFLLL